MTATGGVLDLRGSALCPAEVAVDLGAATGAVVAVDVPELAAEVTVELCAPEAATVAPGAPGA